MRKFTSRRSAVLAVIATLAVSAAAIAYWTVGGSGDATGTVGNATAVALSGSFPAAGIVPGGDAATVSISAVKQDTSYRLGAVTGTVSTSDAGCNPAWFTFTPPASTPQTVTAGDGSQSLATGTIAMTDLPGTNQDACKGATITIALVAAKLADGA